MLSIKKLWPVMSVEQKLDWIDPTRWSKDFIETGTFLVFACCGIIFILLTVFFNSAFTIAQIPGASVENIEGIFVVGAVLRFLFVFAFLLFVMGLTFFLIGIVAEFVRLRKLNKEFDIKKKRVDKK